MSTSPKNASGELPPRRRKGAGLVAVVTADEGSRRTVTVRFGSATVKAPVSKEEWARNIGQGQTAMEKLAKVLVTPGIKGRVPPTLPLYRADPDDPSRVIRLLGGDEVRGSFVDGVFTATE
jgi:hypothetical protein